MTLKEDFPEIARQWDDKKNTTLSIDDISPGSNKKVWWVCDKGHEYKSMIAKRTSRNQGCPYCSGRKAIPGENDLATTHPEVVQEWGDKNSISPQEVKAGSNRKVWWKCDKGHEYQSSLNSHIKGVGCPYCSGHKVLQGFNDLATTHPHLTSQWGENNVVKPTEVSSGSGKKAWWKCSMGHQWEDSVCHRTNGRGCPYCSGKKVSFDTSFAAYYPDYSKQWNIEKNELHPFQVSHQSGKKAWFVCDNGHEYFSRIADRKRFGCPHCSHIVSVGEREVVDYISSLLGEDAVETSNRSIISPYELDIYIPSRSIAIEYNGLYWHTEERGKDKNYHFNKWKMCKDSGIQLLTIWEDEWRDKKDIVKSMLAHKLGVSQGKKVYARNTTVSPLDSSTARSFLDSYHIQGSCFSSAYFGLYDDSDELVAVSAWKKTGDMLYLDRYATSCVVVGGMGKTLKAGTKYAQKQNVDKIVTFSDHQVSDGGLYEKLGFSCDKELSPDYRYVANGERIHKFNYRLKRFRNDPELEYREGLTEKELAQINGLERVWDCGKTRWVMEV